MFEDEKYRSHYISLIQEAVRRDPNLVLLVDIDRYRPSDGDVAPIFVIADF